jgi:hypothetical protein
MKWTKGYFEVYDERISLGIMKTAEISEGNTLQRLLNTVHANANLLHF